MRNFALSKRLYIIAGANGSGKSTLASAFLPVDGVGYVNPDDIARELCPSNIDAVKVEAGRQALKKAREYLDNGESFAIESTLSGVGYVRLIERARVLGYETTIAYIFVDSPEVCIARIAARVKRGGHFVPDVDVRRRYMRSKLNFANIYRMISDHWMLYYNGGSDISLVAHGNGSLNIICEERYAAFMEEVCRNS